MSSGFSGGFSGGFSRSPLAGFVGKRSLAEFQQQHQNHQLYLRNVRPRSYSNISPEYSSESNISSVSRRDGFYNGVMSNYQINNFLRKNENEKKMMNRLQEIEKELLLDEDENDDVSGVSDAAWSETIQSTKQLVSEAAEAISDGKSEIAVELITRLNKLCCSSACGNPEQKLGFQMATALLARLRVAPTATELYRHGLQYVYLLHEIAAARKVDARVPSSLKVTTFKDFGNGGVERLKLVGDGLKSLANKLGVLFYYNVLEFKLSVISRQILMVGNDDVLAVNFAFKLSKLPDESVTTENLRDEVLRRVKSLSPSVVTVAEQELNANTASFTSRVNDVFGYYKTFLDSFDATIPKENADRVKIEEGLSRRIANSVACEGRDRVERCEVFGKWRARMRMAGFDSKQVSQLTVESLRGKLNSGTRGNPGFTVKEDTGGVSFGWLGRTLTVVSAWH
ncbi:Transcription factor GRAS [Artemisia annua]|uniref:Transcription factor GRAS n=1 Tax=Artemisia annua TaxID=35608 RepID=A0A2U1P9C9_ARTAN|nr:Transcription factor GRAS [Artemisia annua]